jgi:hypothetical protein
VIINWAYHSIFLSDFPDAGIESSAGSFFFPAGHDSKYTALQEV